MDFGYNADLNIYIRSNNEGSLHDDLVKAKPYADTVKTQRKQKESLEVNARYPEISDLVKNKTKR